MNKLKLFLVARISLIMCVHNGMIGIHPPCVIKTLMDNNHIVVRAECEICGSSGHATINVNGELSNGIRPLFIQQG